MTLKGIVHRLPEAVAGIQDDICDLTLRLQQELYLLCCKCAFEIMKVRQIQSNLCRIFASQEASSTPTLTAYCRLATRRGALKNTFVRSPHPTNKGAQNWSCSALLSPIQLPRKLVSVRPTQRELGPAPPSFLHSL